MASSKIETKDFEKVALIFANENYQNPKNRSNGPVENGRKLAKILKKLDFKVTKSFDLEQRSMYDEFDNFADRICDGQLVLFYFAGKSCQVNGKNHLIPVNDEDISDEDDLLSIGFHFNKSISRMTRKNRSFITIFILDCPTVYHLADGKKSNGLAPMEPTDGVLIQFACAPNETLSRSTTDDQTKYFTEELIKQIRNENQNIEQIFRGITESVKQRTNGAQIPFLASGIRKYSDIFLNRPLISSIMNMDLGKTENQMKVEQNLLKTHYDNFPSVDDVIDSTRPEMQAAINLTNKILSQPPSGNLEDKNTMCHVLNNMLKTQGDGCLFFDSTGKDKIHDASINLVDLNLEERPFILQLHTCDGLANRNYGSAQEDVRFFEGLNELIKRGSSHQILDDARQRLAKAHSVDKECVVIKNVFQGSMSFTYIIHSAVKPTVEKLKEICKTVKREFPTLKNFKLHPLLAARPCFNISMFDDRGNKNFKNETGVLKVGPKGRERNYKQPSGWTRYGLSVLKDGADNSWLDPFGNPNNWYRVYHGTRNAPFTSSSSSADEKNYAGVDAMSKVYKQGFVPSKAGNFGPGVYCSPDPVFVGNRYAASVTIQVADGSKSYKCMLQAAVNPDAVIEQTEKIWLVENSQNIRAYGILIQDV